MASRVVLLALLVVGSACVQCIHGHEAVDTPNEAPEARLQVILDVDPSGLVDLGINLPFYHPTSCVLPPVAVGCLF